METLLIIAQKQHRPALEKWRCLLSDVSIRVDYLEYILAEGAICYAKRVVAEARSGEADINGVVGLSDQPSLLSAWIAGELGLPGPKFSNIVAAQNKFCAREVQRDCCPEHIPNFALVGAASIVDVNPPLFCKPIFSTVSMGATEVAHVGNACVVAKELRASMLQQNQLVTQMIDEGWINLPEKMDPASFLIEERLSGGRQVTVDGFATGKDVKILGITESHFHPGTKSFSSFNLPSQLSTSLECQMEEVTKGVVEGLELEEALFNVEFLIDEEIQRAFIIEVNTRLSMQFVPLIDWVCAINPLDVMCRIALGRGVEFERSKQRNAKTAVSFVLRKWEDNFVNRIPTENELRALREEFPQVTVVPLVSEGFKLSSYIQDGESFRYCFLDICGVSVEDCERLKRDILSELKFEFSPTKNP